MNNYFLNEEDYDEISPEAAKKIEDAQIPKEVTPKSLMQYVAERRPKPSEEESEYEDRFEEALPGETFLQGVGRHISRSGARALETIAGMPGDIKSILDKVIVGASEYFAGEELPRLRQTTEGIPGVLGSVGPTSEQIKKGITNPIGGKYLEPQNAIEKTADDIVQTIASLRVGNNSLTRAIGTAVAGEAAKEGINLLSHSKTLGELSKLGTIFTLGLFGQGRSAIEYTRQAYRHANELLPNAERVGSTLLVKDLEDIAVNISHGIATKEKQQVMEPIVQLLNKSKDGTIKVRDLVQASHDLNAIRGDPETLKGAKRLLNGVSSAVEKAIERYGEKNPEFYKLHSQANQAFGAIAESEKVADFMAKILPLTPLKTAIGTLFGAASSAVAGHHILGVTTALGVGAGAAAVQGFRLFERIRKSSLLRQYYLEVVNNSIKGNAAATITSLQKLDEALANEEEK